MLHRRNCRFTRRALIAAGLSASIFFSNTAVANANPVEAFLNIPSQPVAIHAGDIRPVASPFNAPGFAHFGTVLASIGGAAAIFALIASLFKTNTQQPTAQQPAAQQPAVTAPAAPTHTPAPSTTNTKISERTQAPTHTPAPATPSPAATPSQPAQPTQPAPAAAAPFRSVAEAEPEESSPRCASDAITPDYGALATADALAVVEETNRVRAERGICPLVWDEELAIGAKGWADHLVRTGRFEHPTHGNFGENLFLSNKYDEPNAADAVRRWLNSPAHRDNLLDPGVTRIAVSIARHDGRYEGGILYVQRFR